MLWKFSWFFFVLSKSYVLPYASAEILARDNHTAFKFCKPLHFSTQTSTSDIEHRLPKSSNTRSGDCWGSPTTAQNGFHIPSTSALSCKASIPRNDNERDKNRDIKQTLLLVMEPWVQGANTQSWPQRALTLTSTPVLTKNQIFLVFPFETLQNIALSAILLRNLQQVQSETCY